MAEASKVKIVPVGAIRENPWNPNRMSEDIMRQTIENIRRFGFNQPILVREVHGSGDTIAYEVVDGAHRFRGAKACDIEKIPVVVVELTDAEAKAQTLAMNKLRGEMAPEDVARLVREIDEDGLPAGELAVFAGFTAAELDDAMRVDDDPPAVDPAPDQTPNVHDGYYVMVTCDGEQAQLALMERLEADGFECRLIVS